MKICITFFLLLSLFSFGQKSEPLTDAQTKSLVLQEIKMKQMGEQMLYDTSQKNRLTSARSYVKLLIEAMKIPNSFQFKFDSIPYMAKVYAEDSSFRIFTFQVVLSDYTYRHYGCIQFNRKNIKIIPFNDCSDTFPITPQYTITNKNWLGAVYYKLLTKSIKSKKVYFLLAFDQNDALTSKKFIEPMWIEGDSIAKFGMPVFDKTAKEFDPNYLKTMYKKHTLYRYVLEYRKGGTLSIKYEKDKDMYIYDHIEPKDTKDKEVGYMKMPDGTFEGLKWDKDKWIWIDYVPIGDHETNEPIRPVPLKKEIQKIEH